MPEKNASFTLARLAAWCSGQSRLLSGLTLCALLAATGLAGYQWLSDEQRFPLEVVQIKGDFRYQQEEGLQQALVAHTRGGFFAIDVDQIRKAVEGLPWIASAQVRRIWPATLRIHITEHEAVAHWNESGFINNSGDVFFPADDGPVPEGLPSLSGPEGQGAKVLARFRRMSRTLQSLDLQLASVALDRRRAWQIQLMNGVELKLGRRSTGERLQRFVLAYPNFFAGRLDALRRVDLRYNNGFSVRWQHAGADVEPSNRKG